MGETDRGRWRLAALLAALLACLYLGLVLRATRWTMDADEAVHAVEGLRLFDRLAAGELGRFLHDTYFPERWHPPVDEHLRWYPFVHAWSLLPAFLLLGPSDFAARLPSVVFLFLTTLCFFELGRRLARVRPGASGFLAVALLLTAPNLLTFSAQCLIEGAVLFACFLALLLYLRSLEVEHRGRRAWLAGGALALAMLTKYDHGGVLAGSLGLSELVRARGSLARLARSTLILFGLPLVLVALWFAHPDKLVSLQDSMRHPFVGSPRALLLDFAATWVVEYGASLAVGLAALGGFVHAARRLREPGLRALWIWALVSLVFYALRARFHFRYNFVEAPIFLLLAGVALPQWHERWCARPAAARCVWSARVTGLLALGALALGLFAREHPDAAYDVLRAPFAWFHGLRADHWGMQLAPAEYIDALQRDLRALMVHLGSSLAALGAGALLLALGKALGRGVPVAALALAALPGAFWLYRELPKLVDWELECHPELNQVYERVLAQGPNRGTTLLGGGWDQLPNNALRWYLITRSQPRPRFDELRVEGDMIGSIVFPPEPRWAYWTERLARAPAGELPEHVVLVEPGARFRYRTRFGPEVELYRTVIERRGSHRSLGRWRFPALDCTVEVLVRETQSVPIEAPLELLRERGVSPPSGAARSWCGEGGWEAKDDSLRHFRARGGA